MLSAPKELRPGDGLGRYELLLPVAKGGMGQVWAARLQGTRGFQKFVAIKTLLPSSEDEEGLEGMLFAEASLASHIHHPNVAAILDLGEQEGTLYLVMEWVDGEPLDYVIRTAAKAGGMPLPIAVNLITQACRGLHAAHHACDSNGRSLGIVHRDISPQNLLVTYSGTVKLVDFGVAKATHQMTQPTVTGQVKGKFAYMSPEQVRAQPVDARTDIFAMGIVLYFLTTGRHPFKGQTPADTLLHIISAEPPLRPAELARGYPPGLEAVVMRALAKERDERFASAYEMSVALEQALTSATQVGTEKQVGAFMQGLFADRILERTQALKQAIESRSVAPGERKSRRTGPHLPRSYSTMRAVMVPTDGGAPENGQGLIGTSQGPETGPPSARSASFRRAVLIGKRLGLATQVGAVTIGLALAAGVVGFERLRAHQSQGAVGSLEASVAAAAPAPDTGTPSALGETAAAGSTNPPALPVVGPVASPEPAGSGRELAERPAPTVRRAPRRERPMAAPSEPARTAAAAPTAQPTPPSPPPEQATKAPALDPLRTRK